MKPNIKIQFPNVLLIPMFSAIGAFLKAFGLSQYDWLMAVVGLPLAFYFMWCIGYCMLALLGFMLITAINTLTK